MSAILIAVEHRQRAHVVDTFTSIDEALVAWTAADDARIRTGTSMIDLFYAVRDDADTNDPTVALLHRSEPAPEPAPKPKRRQTRTVAGVKLVNQGEQRWVSEDGQYIVEYVDTYETECEDEHPVKITPGMRQEAEAARGTARAHFYSDVLRAIDEGGRGYLCPGHETHYYGMWEVGTGHYGGELVAREESFRDALIALGRYIETGETNL